ncbi:MAG: TrkH family potassium uptake protein [Gammaproteobacteria bacterium]|nr:TrkH family potassium uptake protein [Gammaproteobacteria bacterium]
MKTPTLRPIILYNSYILLMMGLVLVAPIAFAIFEITNDDEILFVGMSIVCLLLGGLGVKYNRSTLESISTLQLYLITTCCWLLLGVLGTLPFVLGLPHLSVTDAAFESFSGITTTGSTIFVGIENLPRSILIWRGMLQWIGGIGIVVLSVAVLPHLRVGGMRLFATESSDWSKKTHPRAIHMVAAILYVYLALTVSCGALYLFGGMSAFDAAVHAMTTLSTGGYSNYDASFGHFFNKPVLVWTASLFMVLGALPFVFYVNLVRNGTTHSLLDNQIRGFLVFLFAVIAILGLERVWAGDLPAFEAISHVTFNVISVVTTTGYATTDYTVWSQFSVMVFFFLMFVGGCSGSTAGSMKFFRFQLAYLMLRNQLKQMTYPTGVFVLKYNERVVSDDIIRSVVAFSMFFGLIIAIIALVLALSGLDFITSLTAAATAVTNVGPGLGNIVGPSGNFASLPDHVKWLLCAGMLIGRLEIMTILVLFTPGIWRK